MFNKKYNQFLNDFTTEILYNSGESSRPLQCMNNIRYAASRRKNGVANKIICPKCGNEMELVPSVKSIKKQKVWRIIQLHRYLCYGCFWDLYKWEKPAKTTVFKKQFHTV